MSVDSPCWLVLEGGQVVRGTPFGAPAEARGEIVFNTSMCGYVESLTDPSYCGQILMPTYPLIGNYGVAPGRLWRESGRAQVAGYAVCELTDAHAQRAGRSPLSQFLKSQGVPGISGLDTRALVKEIRSKGTMRCAITRKSPENVLREVRNMDFPDKENLVARVSAKNPLAHRGGKLRVALLDCGAKWGIIDSLKQWATVVQVPYNTPPDEILGLKVGGILVSNGPGDPAHPEILSTCVRTVKALSQEMPVYGICLGHQIIALAFGAKTYKLKFGHRGGNHPVQETKTGAVRITSQNHGFAVSPDMPAGLLATETNLNDGTVEALRHKKLPIASVQYHPEARPGPRDSAQFFDDFRRAVKNASPK